MTRDTIQPYTILEKQVGETPLEVLEAWRKSSGLSTNIPLAYAGRLDPMASGMLLVLIGDECKVQEKYHGLDKSYVIEVAFGLHSDSGDVLGIIGEAGIKKPDVNSLRTELATLIGAIELPYPVFSSRTVHGKPLHTWAMEGRLAEIVIPTKKSNLYKISLLTTRVLTRTQLVTSAIEKISLLPKVTDPRKALGNDFRRPDVLKSWSDFNNGGTATDEFLLAQINCICSSGTYMRTLAEVIAKRLDSTGLAFSIHRDTIGRFDDSSGSWSKVFQ